MSKSEEKGNGDTRPQPTFSWGELAKEIENTPPGDSCEDAKTLADIIALAGKEPSYSVRRNFLIGMRRMQEQGRVEQVAKYERGPKGEWVKKEAWRIVDATPRNP